MPRAALSSDSGSVFDVHYGDVLIKYDSVLNLDSVDLPYIANDDVAAGLTCDSLREGDIVIADTAEDFTTGKCSELRNLGDKQVFSGLHTMPCRPLKEYAPGFLGHYLNAPVFHNQLVPLMQGIKVIALSKAAMADTTMTVPTVEEQTKISGVFSRLDSLITLHQRK